MAHITEIAVTETGSERYPLRLDCRVDGAAKTYFGAGLAGCPEGAQWFEADTGRSATVPGLREALLADSEARLAAERVSELQALEPVETTVQRLRARAFAQVDQRSDQLIAAGFDYGGIRFSASLEAQIRYTNMMVLADTLAPLDCNSLDDSTYLTLPTPDDLRNFCMVALGHVKGIVDSGSAQKEVVRALETAEELTAFVDPRPPPTDVPIEPGG
jgi:hypothetical protein